MALGKIVIPFGRFLRMSWRTILVSTPAALLSSKISRLYEGAVSQNQLALTIALDIPSHPIRHMQSKHHPLANSPDVQIGCRNATESNGFELDRLNRVCRNG